MSVHQPIIQSLLDTDLYKFTMLQVVLHQFPQTHSLYEFRCRNKEMVYPLADIQEDLNASSTLCASCALRMTNSTTCAVCVLSKAILSIISSFSNSNAASSKSVPTIKAV